MDNCDSLFSQANAEFVNENYQSAVDLFTKAIAANKTKSEYFTNRAHAYFKLNEYEKAIEDSENSILLNPNSMKVFIRKGICQFELKRYQEALATFQHGQKLDSNNKTVELWLDSCREKLGLPKEQKQQNSVPNSSTQDANPETSVQSATSAVTPTPAPHRTKYDWYQTQTFTMITILEKNVNKDDIQVDYGDKTFKLVAKLPNGEEYIMQLNLANTIVPAECQVKVTPLKIEVKLKKKEDIHWKHLESSADNTITTPYASVSKDVKETKPLSHFRNWEKFVKEVTEEEKNEKPEGDAALNHLFQQIYADGNDDVKRAMVKSYVESSGTVLSTNWNEVGEKAVDVKPPSGMEYKNWEA
ncbi:protein SGT1 homolog [Octopus bimaculoides]|uniref:Uncharacterized protein n=1 Tax=Octopus bimaculoides TaxID=37653 RepID=A0A0L8IBG3_OCTBM|nr:protein SGT1 homolog [Octopus bimaculoides]|eukprot:XP_014779826.1 PREDICTED: protein SGT1 homolog [Octopus bimaculoides]